MDQQDQSGQDQTGQVPGAQVPGGMGSDQPVGGSVPPVDDAPVAPVNQTPGVPTEPTTPSVDVPEQQPVADVPPVGGQVGGEEPEEGEQGAGSMQ